MKKYRYNDFFKKNLMNYIGKEIIMSNPTIRINGKIIKVSNGNKIWACPYIRIHGLVKYGDGKVLNNDFIFTPSTFKNIKHVYQFIIK